MAFPRIFALPPSALAVGFLAAYVLTDWVSFIQPFAPFGITPWNPPTGLSFVLVLLFGQRYVPLLFVAPLIADIVVRHLPFSWPLELGTSVIIGAGYGLPLLFLLRPSVGFNPALTSMRDLVVLIATAAISSAIVAASYIGVLILSGWVAPADFAGAALRFWIGDLIGVIVVAPFTLIMLTRGRTVTLDFEVAVQIATIFATLVLVFGYAEAHRFELFYILFLPVIWMAVRGGLELVTIGTLVTQIGLIAAVQMLPREGIEVTSFQALMLVLATTGLAAGAVVTQHRRTESQLRLHQESLGRVARLGSMGELAAMIAHEVNQPLMAAGTYARLVADELRTSGSSRDSLVESAEKAAAQVQRAAEVVRQLRALIRLDQSGRAPVAVERIVQETLALARPELERHGIVAQPTIEPGLPQVMVDLLQIEQVLLNVLRNAVEAIAGGGAAAGEVAIGARRSGRELVEIEVRDTGPGFPQDFSTTELPVLSSHKPEGLGLGLSLCRSIIEQHGGTLALGGGLDGAVVRFTLPVVKSGS
jgi:signal transduction histidine kinase